MKRYSVASGGGELRIRDMTIAARSRIMSVTVIRYVAVGACNTIFGFGCFAFFTMLLTPVISYGYVLASLLSNLFSITFAFLGYKWFVFKTHGNYLKEWIRCVGVYTTSILLSAAALPVLVPFIRHQTGNARTAPYLGGAIVLLSSLVFSFLGHRHISFGTSKAAPQSAR